MALFTLIYFLLTMATSVTCHYWVYNALTRDKRDSDDSAFTDTKYYRQVKIQISYSFNFRLEWVKIGNSKF